MILPFGNRARPSGAAADVQNPSRAPRHVKPPEEGRRERKGKRGTMVITSLKEEAFGPIAFNTLAPSGGNMLVFSGADMFIHAGPTLYCVRE